MSWIETTADIRRCGWVPQKKTTEELKAMAMLYDRMLYDRMLVSQFIDDRPL